MDLSTVVCTEYIFPRGAGCARLESRWKFRIWRAFVHKIPCLARCVSRDKPQTRIFGSIDAIAPFGPALSGCHPSTAMDIDRSLAMSEHKLGYYLTAIRSRNADWLSGQSDDVGADRPGFDLVDIKQSVEHSRH